MTDSPTDREQVAVDILRDLFGNLLGEIRTKHKLGTSPKRDAAFVVLDGITNGLNLQASGTDVTDLSSAAARESLARLLVKFSVLQIDDVRSFTREILGLLPTMTPERIDEVFNATSSKHSPGDFGVVVSMAASYAVDHVVTQGPKGAAIRRAAIALALEIPINKDDPATKDERAIGMLEAQLSTYLDRVRALIDASLWQLAGKDSQRAFPPVENGVLAWDARFAALLSTMGAEGARYADRIRDGATKRMAEYESDKTKTQELFALWFPTSDKPSPGFAIALANCLWRDVVAPRLRKQNTKMPTTIIDSWARGRIEGGTIVPGSESIRVHPPRGHTLLLPLNGAVASANGKVPLLSVLDGQMTRAWLAMWALWTRQGCPENGEFRFSVEEVLEEIFGNKQTGRGDGQRLGLDAKSVARLNSTITFLSSIGVTEAGDFEQLRPEPLVNLRRWKSKREAMLVHAGIMIKAVRDDFLQLPQNVCHVDHRAAPLALGIGRLIRPKASTLNLARPRISFPVRTLLEAAGENADASIRKLGPGEHWRRTGERVAQVIEDAGFGKAVIHGEHCKSGDDVMTIELNSTFAEGYRPLIERRAAHVAAEKEKATQKREVSRKCRAR